MFRLPLAPPSSALRIRHASPRHLHASLARQHLVGPPDPVSHMRPVIYDDAPPPPPSQVRHPYSLREFTGDTREYQLKMQRQELDAFNESFWRESNTRFYAAKDAVLAAFPEDTTAEEREVALSEFYSGWVAQENARLDAYGGSWRRRNWAAIALAARVRYERFWARLARPFA
ncbi:uncharacterized protein BXZ73DRAFT_37743 [Epithele typhae]|uniref:uncharacterized protein n=1 Tax=Epithele typhae TaxID=378194 RepID=UPI0020085E73|nr:uncharacterized protein BXZ73DRAFT_37743 [Epithele typhae]KAH9946080.1 hypothetical protein BXZ73DRAFT_37743 [Epithele typhae]